ncbi:hypothetical protein ACQY1Q_06035 [Tenacibaculum sp. TC6]|uniref:hypothetical protein n=1 Tax=Tenacibaculum sp. TC6 TaxID=3423223 RepID=UPI003D35B811
MRKSLIQQQIAWGKTSLVASPKRSNALNGFFDGLNLKDLISTAGTTWAQIEQARNGQPVYVNTPGGQQQDIAPLLVSKLEQQAQQQQKSVDDMMKMLQMQMMNNNKPPQKDNTMLYIGLGIGAIVLLGGVYMITKKK